MLGTPRASRARPRSRFRPSRRAETSIVGTIVQLGIYRYRGGERLDPGALLTVPDPSTIWPATIGGTVDDLIFSAAAIGACSRATLAGVPGECARWTPFLDVTPRTESAGGSYEVLTGL